MLTGKMVRVKFARDRIIPYYLDTDKATWLEMAEQLLEIFRGQDHTTRGEIEADLEEAFGNDPGQLVRQGLTKLLEDRCEFEVVSGHPPEELRDAVFHAAAAQRSSLAAPEGPAAATAPAFDRNTVLASVAASLGLSAEAVDAGLFADLRSEQRLIRFRNISPKHLLERYNVALAQAVLLRSTRVHIVVRNEPPQRYRQLLRQIKFHRLICELNRTGPDSYALHLDGPLSLFSATQKYGLQLALFLPTVLLCKDFELRAELRWGPQRKPKIFTLSSTDGLVSHAPDTGTYVPSELAMFVELFRKRRDDWEIGEETEIFPLGEGFWVPDFRLRHKGSSRRVLLEVLGFWRRSSAEKHLERLRKHVREPFLLAVSDALKIDEAELEGLPAGIHRFRQMPLPDEVARLAEELLGLAPKKKGPA
jgi:predicted nuclease of restriction endonuclease-like RecB superfamily